MVVIITTCRSKGLGLNFRSGRLCRFFYNKLFVFLQRAEAKFKGQRQNNYVLALALLVSRPQWRHTTRIPSAMTYIARQRLCVGVASSSPVAVEQ